MKIETAQVRQRPRRFVGEEPAALLELENEAQFRVVSSVRYALTAQLFEADLLARGIVEVDIRARCARCGEPCAQTIRDADFARSYPLSSANELIDLTADIREAILLALPINFLCSPACRGLCGQCGANLNKTTCACRPPREGRQWGALDKLKLGRK